MKRLYRARAVYRDGTTLTRHYQSKAAADVWASKRREGYEADPSLEADDRPAIPPAVVVTVEPSNPVTWPELVQPPIGGFCDDCGHMAVRHNEDGCHFPPRDGSSSCKCRGMLWLKVRWPRPWLPGPEGVTRSFRAEIKVDPK